MNRQLGCFDGPEAGTGGAGPRASFIDDMTEEWRRRLRPGDKVLYRTGYTDIVHVARIVGIVHSEHSEVGDKLADLYYFGPTHTARPSVRALAWVLIRKEKVGVNLLWPCFADVSAGATVFRASLAEKEQDLMAILTRSLSIKKPCCPRRHGLQTFWNCWITSTERCFICRQALDAGAQRCAACAFHLCSHCLAVGHEIDAFADVLTLSLADDLLRHRGWLSFWATAYFLRSDQAKAKRLSPNDVQRIADRLCAVLKMRPMPHQSVLRAVARARTPCGGAEAARPSTTEEKELHLDEVQFGRFFESLLLKAATYTRTWV